MSDQTSSKAGSESYIKSNSRSRRPVSLLAFFTFLALTSTIAVYGLSQTPVEETASKTLCTYIANAEYKYVALLEPNIIYNRTVLTQNEGTLYAKITEQINITLAYTFNASLGMETTTTSWNLTQTLKTQAWQHPVATTRPAYTNQTNILITIPPINKAQLELIKKRMETETGTSSSAYSLEVSVTFVTEANTSVGTIRQTFMPTLTVAFKRTERGDEIALENLLQTKEGALTKSQTLTRYDVVNERYASYFLAALSISGVCISAHFYRKAKAIANKMPIQKIMSSHRKMIIETHESPGTPADAIIIELSTILELAKTAEILLKPIIFAKLPSPAFVVFDQRVIYQYKP